MLPTVAANCLIPRTFCGDNLTWRNPAQASLTLESWRKEAPSIRFWTLEVEMDTRPVYAKLTRDSRAEESIQDIGMVDWRDSTML